MATVAEVISRKGRRVYCVSPVSTVLDAVQLMARHRIGALVVTTSDSVDLSDSRDGNAAGRVVGIFTERDVLNRVVGEERPARTTTVDEVMTANVAYCLLDTQLEDVAAVMRERRIRHVPVCTSGGKLEGLISIGDLNAHHADGQATEIHYLTDYIQGRV
jgi:CBS domain-containing protein